MAERLEVSFPGGKRVDVTAGIHTIATDQAEKHGGADSAPAPFTLFLASLASCSGIYALNFCHSRNLPTEGLAVSMDWDRGSDGKAIARIRLRLPDGFPERYRESILRAVDLCAVKKQLVDPPAFEMLIED